MITIDILCNANFLRNNINPKKNSLNYQGVTLINNQDGRAAFTSINTGNNDLIYHWFSAMEYYIQNFSDEPLAYGENLQLLLDYYEDLFGIWYLDTDENGNFFLTTASYKIPQMIFILSSMFPMSWDDLNDYCRRVTERNHNGKN
jgi:hypothetical protein